MRHGSLFFLMSGILALSACGPLVTLEGDTDETSDTEIGTTGDESGSSSEGSVSSGEGPTTANPATSTSTTSPGTTDVDETGEEESSSGTTGDEVELCPEEIWPSDGSEVLEVVESSNVAQWNFIGDGSAYFTFLSDDSPVAGLQTRGVSSTKGAETSELFGGTVSTHDVEPYLGKRVRMRAEVARSSVDGRANLWLRVDGDVTDPVSIAAFDNGVERPGYLESADWETEEIVVDVPMDAREFVFGSLLIGTGTFLVADPTFEIVSDDIPTTSPNLRKPAEALSCLSLSDGFAESIVHVFRGDGWEATSPETLGERSVDDSTLYDGVRSLKLSGQLSGEFGGFIAFVRHHPLERWRIRVPIRSSDFQGAATLRFLVPTPEGGSVGYEQPLQLEGDWSEHVVVAEVPAEAPNGAAIALAVEGSGTINVGYGTIERVTDDVPLSAAFAE